MKRLLILLLLFPVILPAQKQGQDAIDSMLKILPAAKEDTNKVKLLNALAFTYSYNSPDEGIKYGQQAFTLAAKLDWKPGIGGANNGIGVNYFTKSDFALALAYYAKALSTYEALNDQKMIARVLDNTAVVYADQGDYAIALDCLHKALKISQATGDKLSYKNNLTILGNIYFDQCDYTQSLEYYFRALKVAEEMGDKHGIFLAQEGISTIYAVQKEYPKALEYNNKDLKIAREIGNKQDIAAVNTNIGGMFASQNNYTKALEYFLDALKIEQEVGQKKDIAILSTNIGNAYAVIKNFPLALAYNENALKIASEIEDKYVVVQDLVAISDAYLGIVRDPAALQTVKMGNKSELMEMQLPMPKIPMGRTALLDAATDQLQRALSMAKQMHTPDLVQACYEHLADAGKLSGNYKQALEYADSASAIKDTVFSKANKTTITNLETNRALDLKQKQIEIDQLELAKKRNERFFYIAAIILLTTIGLLFTNRQYLKRRKVEAERKNAEALQYLAEKDKDRAKYLLNERVKELSTIYQVNNILADENKVTGDIFYEIVTMLPQGWQYPQFCEARIVFDGSEYKSLNYVSSPYIQSAPIKTQDGRTGLIEVIYTAEMPDEAEGPFLKEERDLINALANIIEVYFNKKSNQDALAKSEARFRSSFEHSAIGMALVAPDGVFMKVNSALCSMLGYTEQELLSRSFREITHPEHADVDVENVKPLLEGTKDYYRTEKRYLHKNGSVIWVNLNSAIIRDSSSRPLYFVSQIEDVTAKKESEQKFQGIVEKSVVGVYILQDNKFIYVNPRVCEESGYTEEELTSLPIEKFVHKDDMMTVYRNLKARMNGEVDEVRYDVRAIKKDGGIIWLEMFGTIMEYRGAPAIIGTMVNITEKKQVYNELERSEANLKSIFNNTQASFMLLDDKINILAFNEYFATGYASQTGFQLKPEANLLDLVLPDKRGLIRKVFETVRESGQPVEYENAYANTGTPQYFSITVSPVINNGVLIGFCHVGFNTTNRKKLENEREGIIKDLLQRNRDLEQFAHIVSHNIRGPLATIIGLNNLLQDDMPRDEAKFLLEGIRSSTEKLDVVIWDLNEILQVRRELSEAKVAVDLNKIVSEITGSISLLIKESNAVIETDFAAVNDLLTVRSYISSIFYNLITNSIKYCKPGIPPVIKIGTQLHDGDIIITFRDNGMGMDLIKNKEKLFMLYQRFHFAVEGKGMGLFMTKTQVEVLNGKIELESELGAGTTFRLTFPL